MIRTTPKAPEMRIRGKRRHLEDYGITKRRGRPPSDQSKIRIGIRLDRDVIAKFRATGEGWQTRINDALKAAKI